MKRKSPAIDRHPIWLRPSVRLFTWFGERIKTGDPAATLDRFFVSKHVKDLRVIIEVTLFAVMVVFVLGLLLSFEHEWNKIVAPDPPAHGPPAVSGWAYFELYFIHLGSATLQSFLTFFGPAIAVFGAVVAWAYQAGGARLGVVDLFACEIDTLCRVGTVLDIVPHLIEKLDAPPSLPAASDIAGRSSDQFTSKEDYFPVFENNTKDLQSLEAEVVINITAFYTYMKSVRDAMRALPGKTTQERHNAARDLVYLLYLGLESGRKAIEDLVEFEPQQAERTIVVLLSELVAYCFLRCEFSDPNDMRCKRLEMRKRVYEQKISNLSTLVEDGHKGHKAAQWEPAWLLLPELHARYERAMDATKAIRPVQPVAV